MIAETKEVSITFVEKTGIRKIVKANVGETLMQVAKNNDVVGIDGDCGGACSCGTCCMLINNLGDLGLSEPSDEELGILEFVSDEVVVGQRLGCQVIVSETMDLSSIEVAT